jgi:hypothetical protein
MPDLFVLFIFVRVAELMSFTRAAETLGTRKAACPRQFVSWNERWAPPSCIAPPEPCD